MELIFDAEKAGLPFFRPRTLKRCPRCGGQAMPIQNCREFYYDPNAPYIVICTVCSKSTKEHKNEEDAIEEWGYYYTPQ